MSKNKSPGEVWSVDTSAIQDFDNLALIYEREEDDYIFQMLLCDPDTSSLTDMDIVIPKENTDTEFEMKIECDASFPMTEENFKNYIGKIDHDALNQIKALKEGTQDLEIKLEVGKPILFKSDKRYFAKIDKLLVINHLATSALQDLLQINNVVFMIEHKDNILESIKNDPNAFEMLPLLEAERARVSVEDDGRSLKLVAA